MLPVFMHRDGTLGQDVRRQLGSWTNWLIVALFSLLSGVAFVVTLNAFVDQSTQALSTPPPEPINVNQLLIRPFLRWVGLAALAVLPLVTMRVRTFAASLALYAVMLTAPMMLLATLFLFGTPEWGSIVTGYAGLLLMGAAFLSVGLFISSLATSRVAAGFATFTTSLMVAGAAWLARAGTPTAQSVFSYFSAGDALDDFAKGVVDTGHVVSCLAIAALGVFLTRRVMHSPPHTQRLAPDNRPLTTN